MKHYILAITSLLAAMLAVGQKPGAFTGKYAETKTIEQTDNFFGTSVSDPYRWLEDDMSAETKDWVQRQTVLQMRTSPIFLTEIRLRNVLPSFGITRSLEHLLKKEIIIITIKTTACKTRKFCIEKRRASLQKYF
jgi:hypothetical protein